MAAAPPAHRCCTRRWRWPPGWRRRWSSTGDERAQLVPLRQRQLRFRPTPIFESVNYGWYMPHGFHTPAAGRHVRAALHAPPRRHQRDFGRVSVAARDFAATNPAAFFHGKPITLAEHQASRWICRAPAPARLLPGERRCGGDGHHLRRARARFQAGRPVLIKAGAQGISRRPADHDLAVSRRHHRPARDGAWWRASCGAAERPDAPDIQTAVIYDHFTPFVLQQLEEFGFCERGEAKDFVRAGHHARGGTVAAQYPRRPARRGLHPWQA